MEIADTLSRWTRLWGPLSALLWGALFACVPAPAQPLAGDEDPAPVEPEEVMLAYRYGTVASGYVSALYHDGQFLLPVAELFDALRIKMDEATDGSGGRVITGFFVRSRRRYRLDFDRGEAEVEDRRVPLIEDSFFVTDRGVFVHPDVLASLFGLRCEVDFGKLAVRIEADEPLPARVEAERRRLRRLEQTEAGAATTLLPRTSRRLGGGVADYRLRLGAESLGLALSAGAEVGGGGLQYSANGRLGEGTAWGNHRLAWHRVFDRGPYLTQARAGDLVSVGGRSLAYRGISLTNAPHELPDAYSRLQLEGRLEPGWETELYHDGRLVGLAQEPGPYRFDLPIRYGTTRIRTVTFGPRGEVERRRLRYETPASLVPAGALRYRLDAGWAEDVGAVGHGELGYGVRDGLTVRVGRNREVGADAAREAFYGGLTARLGVHHLVEAQVAPRTVTRLGFRGTLPSQLTYRLGYDRFAGPLAAGAPSAFGRGARAETSLAGYLPLRSDQTAGGIGLRALRIEYAEYAEYLGQGVVTASRRGVNARLQADLGLVSDVGGLSASRLQLTPSLSFRPRLGGRHLRTTYAGFRTTFDVLDRKFGRFEVSLSGSVGTRGEFQLGASYDVRTQRVGAVLGYRLHLTPVQVTTSVHARAGGTTLEAGLLGSVTYDPVNRSAVFHHRPLVGRGNAAVRVYADLDASGRYDAGEPVLEHVGVRLRRGAYARQRSARATRLLSLRPDVPYALEVDEATLGDPFLVPAAKVYRFDVAPNGMSVVDVPLVRAGSLEGAVTYTNGAPAPGVALTLRRESDGEERVLRTFSDGTFFEYAIPPGTWRIRPDAQQLGRLGLRSLPAEQTVEVRALPDGDIVTGVSFTLEAAPDARP